MLHGAHTVCSRRGGRAGAPGALLRDPAGAARVGRGSAAAEEAETRPPRRSGPPTAHAPRGAGGVGKRRLQPGRSHRRAPGGSDSRRWRPERRTPAPGSAGLRPSESHLLAPASASGHCSFGPRPGCASPGECRPRCAARCGLRGRVARRAGASAPQARSILCAWPGSPRLSTCGWPAAPPGDPGVGSPVKVPAPPGAPRFPGQARWLPSQLPAASRRR